MRPQSLLGKLADGGFDLFDGQQKIGKHNDFGKAPQVMFCRQGAKDLMRQMGVDIVGQLFRRGILAGGRHQSRQADALARPRQHGADGQGQHQRPLLLAGF